MTSLAELRRQKLAEQKAKSFDEKPDTKLNFKTDEKAEKVIISLKDGFIGEINEIESFIELLPELDIDGVSSFYNILTGKKRIHTKGAKTTKNYMINAIIKRFEQSKTKKKVKK